jgi:hypothetical protein
VLELLRLLVLGLRVVDRFRELVARFRELLLFQAEALRPPLLPAVRTVIRPLPLRLRDDVCRFRDVVFRLREVVFLPAVLRLRADDARFRVALTRRRARPVVAAGSRAIKAAARISRSPSG